MKSLKQIIKTTMPDLLNEGVVSNAQYNVYHGTSFDFDEFKTKRKISGYGYSMGAYFSSSETEAKRYGKHIKKYALKFNKLLDLSFIDENDKNGKEKFFNFINNELNISFPSQKNMIYSNPYFGYTTLEGLDKKFNLIPLIKRKGFDGICFNEGNGITFVAFNNKSIKNIE